MINGEQNNMTTQDQADEARIDAFLAPLDEIPPASIPQLEPVTQRRRPRVRSVALVATTLVVAAGGAAVAATQVFGPLHDVKQQPDSNSLTCSGVIGEPANQASAYFSSHGYHVSWRYEQFGSKVDGSGAPGTPTAISGNYTSTVDEPPAGSAVADVLSAENGDPKSAIVLVRDPDDPNAPRIVPPDGC